MRWRGRVESRETILRVFLKYPIIKNKGETSQSTVIRKLSSYTQTNSTLKALIEFDKIIMSIYNA